MSDEEKAKNLIQRVREGERTRKLVEEIDRFCSKTDNIDARNSVTLEMYTILADTPDLFVNNYDDLFSDLNTSDPSEGILTTYSFLSEDPPAAFRWYINDLLTLLGHDSTRIQASTCRMLSQLAQQYPDAAAEATVGLQALLDHKNPIIRGESCLALGYIGAVEAKDDIKQLQDDVEQRNQRIANWAISRIDGIQERFQWSHADLLSYTSTEFEELVADLYSAMGYETKVTPATRDGGYDVKAIKNGNTVFLEAKRWDENPVGVKTARELLGAGLAGGADRVTLVTSSTVTRDARKMMTEPDSETKGPSFAWVDGKLLIVWLEEFEIKPPN